MAFAINLLVSGLATGLLYALTGLGLVVVYRTTRILNFAGGDIATVLAYFTYVLLVVLHFPYYVSAPATLIAGAALGYLFSRGIIDPLGRRAGRWLRIRGMYEDHTVLNIVIGTFAFAMLAQGLEQIIAGSEIGTLPSLFGNATFRYGGIAIGYDNAAIIVVSLLLFGILSWFFDRTSLGIAMQAAYDNPLATELVGLDLHRIYTASWTISGVLFAIAALFATPVTYLTNTSLVVFMFSAFAAVVLGGLASFRGAVIGGCFFGIANNLIAAYISSSFEQVLVFVVMLAVLLVRPYGLLGQKGQGFSRV